MACSHDSLRQGNTYTTADGRQFATRVIASLVEQPELWNALLNKPYDEVLPRFHNIPNGAGPGTMVVSSGNAWADWTLETSRDRVPTVQRGYTGPASWEQFYMEDGGNLSCRVSGTGPILGVNADGLWSSRPPPGIRNQPNVIAAWFPSGTNVPSFDRLSIMTGPTAPTLPNGFPLRSLAGGNSYFFAPPGNCRFFAYTGPNTAGTGDADLAIMYDSTLPGVNFTIGTFPGVDRYVGSCPSWGMVQVTNTTGVAINFTMDWNRFPMNSGF